MDIATQSHDRTPYRAERSVSGERFLVSDDVNLMSVAFVIEAFGSKEMWWAKPFDPETTRTMLQNSKTFGLYRFEDCAAGTPQAENQESLRQIGMARLVTDRVTYAWLTDVYVWPEYQGKGLGKWLLEGPKRFLDGLPSLRRAMTMTSTHAPLYEKSFGMQVHAQEAGSGLVMTTVKDAHG